MKLAITICATQAYSYALGMQAQAVCNSVKEYQRSNYDKLEEINVILVASPNDNKIRKVGDFYTKQIAAKVHIINVPDSDKNKNYKQDAQLLIAKLRSLAFNKAKELGTTHCWSLDSDVIPKVNSLYVMRHTLDFDVDYYQVASCVYPSQGGGLFLCGRGTPRRHILEDIYPEEKDVPEVILNRIKLLEEKINELQNILINKKTEEPQKIAKELEVTIKKRRLWAKFVDKKAKLKSANVFELNAKQWRRRGWFDFAYPAIGKGAIVPTDWMGFGCALINEKALNLIDFSGYNGGGTEDLYIIWNRWYPNGIKIAAIPHCPADHIIRKHNKKERINPKTSKKEIISEIEYLHVFTYHETEGECVGHLRPEMRPFKEFDL